MPSHRDQIIMDIVKHPTGSHGIRITTPEDVLPVHHKEELEALLTFYAKTVLKEMVKDTEFARRHYVEKIRPALRFYCKVFQRDVPRWLKDDDLYIKVMSDEERQHFFGEEKLHIKEFKGLAQFKNPGTGRPRGAPPPAPPAEKA